MNNTNKILVLGAGRSAGYLIAYLDEFCIKTGRSLCVCDRQFGELRSVFGISEGVEFVTLDVTDKESLWNQIAGAALVVSLLPPALHVLAAEGCLEHGKSLFTASYISPAMRAMGEAVEGEGLLFMNELGLDPGIDHLCVNAMMDKLHAENAGLEEESQWRLVGFESYCGGLVAESGDKSNPWKYKFSWNPTNVILAGQGGESVYREHGDEKRIGWQEVFASAKTIELPGVGVFDVYPNRDSLGYEEVYGMTGVPTLVRGTLRRQGYCDAWQCLVESGFTQNDVFFDEEVTSPETAFQWITGYDNQLDWIDEQLAYRFSWSEDRLLQLEEKLTFLQLANSKFWLDNGLLENWEWKAKSVAAYLEHLLLLQWRLEDNDKDEVVMAHILHLENGKKQKKELVSVMCVQGESKDKTAMAKTVGLPLAMGVEVFLENDIKEVGVRLPWGEVWYRLLLPQLEKFGVKFVESERFS